MRTTTPAAAPAPAPAPGVPSPVFYTAATDGRVRIFDMRSPTCVGEFHVQGRGATSLVPVLGLTAMPDVHALVTSSADARVRTWDTRTLSPLLVFAHPGGRPFMRCDARLGGVLAGDVDGSAHWFPAVPFTAVL